MKIFISADIEGISGVIHREHSISGTGNYERARKLMTEEVNAAIKGAVEAGADEILVNDSHGSMRNIILEDLHPEARLITGFPKPLLMMEGIDNTFNGAVFIGYHSMAGTGGVLAHTISGFTFSSIKLNGIEYGETGLNAAIAGDFGVPVLSVSGDDCLREEVNNSLPGIEFAEVKQARGGMSANCMNPVKARQLITEKVKKSVTSIGNYKPFIIKGPIKAEIVLKSVPITEVVSVIPGVERISPTAVSYQASNVIEAMRMISTMMNVSCVLMMDIFK